MATPDHRAGLSPDAHAVIGVVLEALDIPYAATVAHDETRSKILGERLMATLVELRGVARRDRAEDLVRDLADLRERLAERPAVGYVTHDQAHERLATGATWTEAVRLDYDGPAEVA